MNILIPDDALFEVFKYEVYYSYYGEIEVIIPEDRWGFILDDIQYDEYIDWRNTHLLFPDYYVFTRNEEHESLDIYLPRDTNMEAIRDYISDHNILHTYYPGDVIENNGCIFPIGESTTLPDISKIEKDIRSVVQMDLESDDELLCLFPHGYTNTENNSIYNMSIKLPIKNTLFSVYFYHPHQEPNKTYVHATDHKHSPKDVTYKQYVRCTHVLWDDMGYIPTASLFVQRVDSLPDISIIHT